MADDPKFRITPPAQADLVDIADYTRERWGLAQQESYIGGLFAFFGDLAAMPTLGRVRLTSRPHVLSSLYQRRHVVFYRREGGMIDILRVLHVKRDAEAAFKD